MPNETPRILIVDDDPGQRSLLESFLRGQGFETVLAESGERALERLPAGKFSMMISDVRMPGLSGLETLRRVRQDFPTLPVLLVTAYADIRDAVVAMRDGALNYLAKPIDLDELLATVHQATGLAPAATLQLGAEKSLPPNVIAKSPLTVALFQQVAL
ncbi:MAG TPA: response regulator, partial [bacterium]|nr:response regulator [bacterium]